MAATPFVSGTPQVLQALRNAGCPSRNLVPPSKNHAIPQAASSVSSSGPAFCKILSGSTSNGYMVDVYSNGKGSAVTASGVGPIFVNDQAVGSDLPAGTWILAYPANVVVTGGS